MFTTIQLTRDIDPEFHSSVYELFQSTSRTLIYAIGAIYLVFIMLASVWPAQIATNAWLIVPASMFLFWLGLKLLPRVYLVGHIIFQVGLVGSITLAVYLFQRPEIALFYALLPLISIVCLGWQTGSLMEIVILGMVWWVNHGLLAEPPPVTLSLIVMIAGITSGILGWASMQAVLTVTKWSLYSFQAAQKNLTDARNHQGRLAQVVKELDSANIRLERLNHMLVIARSEAEEAKDARNRFALAISHELRTPLNFIISFSEIMVNTPTAYAALNRWPRGLYNDIQEIFRSSQHLMRLVNDVLDLGQIENLRMSLIKEWISLSQVVSEVTGMLNRSFELKKVALRTDIEPDLPIVYVDRTRVRQVLLNLANNSLRFTDQGAVTIRLQRHEKDTLLITVEDTGTGIAQADMPRIFEEFQQAGQDSWRRREGAGLGLPISKRLIELHGGQMWAESTLGEGTRFYFTIPVAVVNHPAGLIDKEREEKYWMMMKEKAEKGKNILVISSDPAGGEIIAPYVENYSLETVSPADDFYSLARVLLPSAIFLDQLVANEADVLAQLKRLPYDLPVISFNFPGNPNHPHDLPKCVRYYLVKPFSNQALVDAVLSLGSAARRLLVVDDDPGMVTLVTRALQSRVKDTSEGRYLVEAANTGSEALREIRENPPDAILLDVTLPDMSGMDILARLEHLNIPVIFITAHEWPQVFPEHEYEALRIQMQRPLNRYELPVVLKNLLEVIHPAYPADVSGLVP
jgi:signal transduction histidine kinase/CheY-like chemotaxis protein